MQVELIGTRLVGAGLGLTIGKNLFFHYMSPEISSGVLLLTSLAGNSIDPQLPGWRQTDKFQAIIRTPDLGRSDGMTLARNIVAATVTETPLTLTYPADPTIPSVQIYHIRATQDPIPYQRQLSGVFEISLNFTASYVVL